MDNKIDAELVHVILGKYKAVHSYDGMNFFDAQNKIFPNWFISVYLLNDGTCLMIDETKEDKTCEPNMKP
jgi:phage major head subunit gpT-like protein